MSREIIIAGASCLIVLQNVRELSLLQKLFGEVLITEEVEKEFGLILPEWITVKAVQNEAQNNSLSLILDKGEASSIALCLETDNALLIIDEKKGRRIAQELKIKITGTLGIILRAKEKGLVDSIEDLLAKLDKADFRISPNLKAKILENE